MDEQDAEQGAGKGQAIGKVPHVGVDPVVGKDVGVRGEGEHAMVEIFEHVPHADSGCGKPGNNQQKKMEPEALWFGARWRRRSRGDCCSGQVSPARECRSFSDGDVS